MIRLFKCVFFVYELKERIEMKLPCLLIMGAITGAAVPSLAAQLPPNKLRFNDLAQQCSSGVHPNTLQAVARVESGFNPYAIGVVKGRLQRQPRTYAEAVATAKSLHAQGKNFSLGLMQVNRYNLPTYGLNYETVFDPCKNINAGAKILKSCFDRAGGKGQAALQKAFSCYYSGNFRFGFKSDFKGQPPYVTKIILSAMDNSPHQTINHSGSLKTNSSNSGQTRSMKTSYVPQPSHKQKQSEYIPMPQLSNNQQAEYIPMPQVSQATEQQVAQPNSATGKPVTVLPTETAAVAKATATWDVFGDF